MGKDGERAFGKLLDDRGYQAFRRPRGESGDDYTAIDKDGRAWSVEVKNTTSLMYSHFMQCRDNSEGKNRMLAWHPRKWGFRRETFVVFLWPRGGDTEVQLWR